MLICIKELQIGRKAEDHDFENVTLGRDEPWSLSFAGAVTGKSDQADEKGEIAP